MVKWVLAAGVGFLLGSATTAGLRAPATRAVALGDLPKPYYRVLWENHEIRVVEHLLEPGDREPMHYHPRMIGYFLETSTVRVRESNGTTEEAVLIKGTIAEAGPWTHEIANIGQTPLHSLIVEFKTERQ
ncbi:MAG: hypothetical protein JNM53_12885 [Gemmatimonadetes bacterium]|nr:hypothetical protein [Gemmatimonadota bacterium]